MATYTQDLIFTVLPFGETTTGRRPFLDFSVIVTPRLQAPTTSATQKLGGYLDWASPSTGAGRTWPETRRRVPSTPDARAGRAGLARPTRRPS